MNNMGEDNDLEADIRAAITGEAKPEAVVDDVEADVAAAVKEDDSGRLRAADGKFAPKPVDNAKVSQEVVAAEGEEPERTILSPKSWTAAAKAKFALLDSDVQAEVLRREKEIDDGKAQWDTKAQQYNQFDALFAPIDDRLALSGLDRQAYVRALIQADEMLRRDPNAALAQLAQMYGFQLPNGSQQYAQPQADPALQAIRQQLDQLTQHVATQAQAKEAAEKGEVLSEVETFRNDPKNPYFDNVRDRMVALLEKGIAQNLQDAYDQACYSDPQVRAAMQIKPVAPGKPAKPAGLSVTGAPGNARPPSHVNPRSSHEDDVRAALEELTGRI